MCSLLDTFACCWRCMLHLPPQTLSETSCLLAGCRLENDNSLRIPAWKVSSIQHRRMSAICMLPTVRHHHRTSHPQAFFAAAGLKKDDSLRMPEASFASFATLAACRDSAAFCSEGRQAGGCEQCRLDGLAA